MKVKKLTLHANAYPAGLRNIPSPPKELFYLGAEPSDWLDRPKIAVVGSQLPAVNFSQALTMLEISGKVRSLGNNHWSLK